MGFGVAPDQVAVIAEDDVEALGKAWANESIRLVLRHARVPGDFPQSLLLDVHDNVTGDFLAAIEKVSRQLDVAVLTDEVGVEPAFDDDWLLVTPGGSNAVISVDTDMLDADVPAIVLTPDSRKTYESLMHRPLVAAG